MSLLIDMRRLFVAVLGPLLGICALAYFGYHAVQGERGVVRYLQLRLDLRQAENALAVVKAEKKAIEDRVVALRPGSLDPDLIEERARIMLNMGREGEWVVILPSSPTN